MCVCVFVCRFEHRFGVVRIPLQEKLFVEPRKHCKTMAQPRSCSSPDKLVCVPQLSFEPLGLPLFLLQAHQPCALVSRRALQAAADREPFRSLGMCSRGRSRSRSRSAERAKLLAERCAAQKGRFLREHDSKDAAVRPRRCFNPQCSREWTTAPYGLWVHVSCTATDCISYLHDEIARIQTDLRSLDSEESIRSLKCSGR